METVLVVPAVAFVNVKDPSRLFPIDGTPPLSVRSNPPTAVASPVTVFVAEEYRISLTVVTKGYVAVVNPGSFAAPLDANRAPVDATGPTVVIAPVPEPISTAWSVIVARPVPPDGTSKGPPGRVTTPEDVILIAVVPADGEDPVVILKESESELSIPAEKLPPPFTKNPVKASPANGSTISCRFTPAAAFTKVF
jgi:hypothetical protein